MRKSLDRPCRLISFHVFFKPALADIPEAELIDTGVCVSYLPLIWMLMKSSGHPLNFLDYSNALVLEDSLPWDWSVCDALEASGIYHWWW